MASQILHIEEQAAPAHRPSPQLNAFFGLGFRPLYIAGCGWALISIAIWIFAPSIIGHPLSGLAWHAHEMLWGFIATIAAGFLLTASATWTGFNPLKGRALALVCALWVIARIGYLFGGEIGFRVACVCESAFFLICAVALMRVVLKAKSRRNYGIPLLMLGLGVANALYLQAALGGDYALLMQRFNLGLICMAVIALLIARRVIPFFAMRTIQGLKIPMLTRSGHVQLALAVLAIVCGLAGFERLMAAALAIVGAISLFQLFSWKPLAVRSAPLVWILYIGYAALGLGLIVAACYLSGLETGALARPATHVHLIALGGFSVLIIGMVTRTALGHLGRPLALDGSMRASYVLVLAAVVLRLAALWPSVAGLWLLEASALCWIVAFALYLWRFTPMLIRPRTS
ncbi:MAG: NnrS family protein [Paralcaligenes sp.]